jgi:hypothetical protein
MMAKIGKIKAYLLLRYAPATRKIARVGEKLKRLG